MERQPHATSFVSANSIAEHESAFAASDIRYLTILDHEEAPVGFFILALEDDNETVEFRRIVVDSSRRGVGQVALGLMEDYCRTMLERSKIWLDVFDDNEVGIHIYEKFGYVLDRTEPFNGRTLRFYSKDLHQRTNK